jgi:hypothetical protein
MNCQELAAVLEQTLIRDCDPGWIKAASEHAARCPSCARSLELYRAEEHLCSLPAVEPSSRLLDTVMSRIALEAPRVVHPWQSGVLSAIKYPALAIGAVVLSFAYLVPAVGADLLSNLRSSPGLLSGLQMSNYVLRHPPWAMLLIGLAAILLLVGLELPGQPDLTNDATQAR